MDFRLLGSLEVTARGAVAELGPPKQRALLTILLLHAGEIVSIDRLIDLLWDDKPPRTATHSIQIYVSDLRRSLEGLGGDRILATRPPGYQLDADPASIDTTQFERLVQEGTRALRAGDRAGGAASLRAALRLWRGPALSDFAYEEFAQPYIRRFHDMHLDAVEELAAAELEAGQASEVVPMLDAAIRDDPLRERSRELLMLALYRSGRHAEALRTHQQLRSLLVEELGLEPSPPLQRLQERILLHDPSLLPPRGAAAGPAQARNPYKGLRPFDESDADDFFGRDELVARLLDALAGGARLIALVGPSGSGKSSAIAAGLIPVLRGGAVRGSVGWAIAQMTPGANPLAEAESVVSEAASVPTGVGQILESAPPVGLPLIRGGGHLLLVIDQFEEVFAITDEPHRRQFLSAVATSVNEPDTHLTVLLALRADYYDRPLLHAEFAEVFSSGVVNTLPMTARELEAAIVRPAQRAGVAIEPALLAELVADAADRPGTLPLLEFALTELFDHKTGASLTVDGYHTLGGLRGVLSRSAEALYGALTPDERQVAMQVFLRLVQLGRGTAESRRRLPILELTGLELDPVVLSKVLDSFGRRRLLSFDRDPVTGQATVEIAHESLFREWERLAAWIDRHRAALQRYETFLAATEEWEASGRHPDYLLAGTRLAELEAWSVEGTLLVTEKQRAFLAAGLARQRSEQAAERSRAEGERRLERRARRRLVALGVVVAVVIGGTGYGVWSGLFSPAARVALLHSGEGEVDVLHEAGFDRAVSEFGLVGQDQVLTAFSDQYTGDIRAVAGTGVDLIIITEGAWNADEFVREFPDTNFVWAHRVGDAPNAAYFSFTEQEGAYLAGVAAALTSTTHSIGFIGGYDDSIIWTWHAGFEAGARSIDPEIRIASAYLSPQGDASGFRNAAAAEHEASRMYAAGADVVFHAAGDSGVGVFEAATALSTAGRQLWAIGVDSDQYETVGSISGAVHPDEWRDHILTSVLKRVDLATYEFLAEYAQGVFRPGQHTFDLESGGMDISFSGNYIDEIAGEIQAAREGIISGQISVPCIPAAKLSLAEARGYAVDFCHG
jgi:basic membrane lipoprotein Med (substrate-binding protein (PBP1-ABC) superfamily)/DNA-binding SARP family transcriptional activator